MNSESKLRNYLIMPLDAGIVFLCFYMVLLLGGKNAFAELLNLRKIVYIPVASTILIFIFTDMYKVIFKRYSEIVFNCALAGIAGTLLFILFVNIRPWHSETVKIPYILVMLLLAAFLGGERILVEFCYRAFMKTKKVAIVGTIDQCRKTGYEFIKNKGKTHDLKYMFDVGTGVGRLKEYYHDIDIIILCPGAGKEIKDEIVSGAAGYGIRVYMIPELYEINTMRPRLTQIDDTPYLYFDSSGFSTEEKFIKRLFDLIVSLTLLTPAALIIFFCAIAIKIESKGPAIYRQARVGSRGEFRIYKLRTMIDGAEKNTGAVLSSSGDARVTSVGKFLRKTRLDEIPQIINVIKGDMSLIGPRPERPEFVKRHEEIMPEYAKRHVVKPGISGLAQIMGKYSTRAEDKLRYDLIYIRNYSFFMDIKIFFLTIKTVFLEPGSVFEDGETDYEEKLAGNDIRIIV